jgi:hypothetical protein
MITILYRCDGFEPGNDEDDHHVDDVVEEDELGEPINYTMDTFIPKFKEANESTHMMCND